MSWKACWIWHLTILQYRCLNTFVWSASWILLEVAGWFSLVTLTYLSGWWFGTFFIFHNIWDVILPNWRSYFQRGRYTTNQLYLRWFLDFIHGVTAWASKRVVPVPPIQRQVPVLLWLFNGHSLELQFKDQKKDLFTRICTYYIVLQYDYMLVLLNSSSIWWFFPGY